MKNMIKLLMLSALTLLAPVAAFAHTGHGQEQAAHATLHGEHVLVLSMVAVLVFLVNRFRND